MKRNLLPGSCRLAALLLLCLVQSNLVQGQTWLNARAFGNSAGGEVGRSVCTDASGNFYVTGSFTGTVDFDPTAGANNLTATSADVVVTKYNSSGVYQWAVQIGGSSSSGDNPMSIATNGTDVYVMGTFVNTTVAGATTLTSVGGTDIFVAKLNASNGAFQWAKNFGSTLGDGTNGSICLDGSGNVYFTGTFNGSATFGSTTLTANGSTGTEMFVAKLNPANGNVVWASSGGSNAAPDNSYGICYVPALDEVVVCGTYSAAATYGSVSMAHSGGNDAVLLEVNASTGAFISGTGASTATGEDAYSVCYDSHTGNVFMAGMYTSSVTFGSNPALTNSGNEDLFVARYNPSTNTFVWAKGFGGTAQDRAMGIASDGAGNIYIAGYFRSSGLVFGTSTLSSLVSTAADAFVASLSATNGDANWALQGGSSTTNIDDQARSVAVTTAGGGRVTITGQSTAGAAFGSQSVTNSGSVDMFFAQAGIPISASTTQTNATCNGLCNGSATVTATGGSGPYSYSWSPSGGTGATASNLCAGTYNVTVTDANSNFVVKTVTITEPASAVGGSTVVTNVACNGGTNGAINLTPSGGTGPYTFNWGGGITTEDRTGLAAGNYSVTITDAGGCTGTVNATVTQPSSPVSGTTVVTNVACNGGTNGAINLTPSGGTGPYTFNWGGGITTEDRTGLAAGNYAVTIMDNNGCTGTVNVSVSQPATAVSGSTVITNVACHGGNNGAINLTPSGGAGSYSYDWGGGVATEDRTGLSAGNYSVTITDANGCSAVVNATVTQPAAPVSGSTVVNNVTCHGGSNGSVNLTPSGGTSPYTFNWGGGVTTEDRTGLSAGSYTVIITDANSCTGTVNVNVTQPSSAPSVSAGSDIAVCAGQQATLTGSGTGIVSYSWNNGITNGVAFTPGATATYTVTGTDANGCTATDEVLVTVNALPAVNAGSDAAVCAGASVTLNGSGAVSYTWNNGVTNGVSFTPSSTTTYTVTGTDGNNCTNTDQVTVTVNALPVLTPSQINVSCFGGSTGQAAVSVSGNGGYSYSWTGSSSTAASATGLTAGSYTVTVTDANNCQASQGFTITEPAAALSASISAQTNVSSFGGNDGAATVTATGGTPAYAYSWSPSGGSAATATGLTAGTYTVTVTDANNCTTTATATITEPSGVPATFDTHPQSRTVCAAAANVSFAADVTGATAYQWQQSNNGGSNWTNITASASVTGEQTDSLTILDVAGYNGFMFRLGATGAGGQQSFSNAATLTAVTVAATGAQTNVSCNGGTNGAASVTASGGVTPYSYSWTGVSSTNASVSGLGAGSYSVTVTDAIGCTAASNFTITEPATLDASIGSSTDVTCFGGSNGTATAAATGGTAAYSFAWDNGANTAAITGLAAGTYTVTVTDNNGCTDTAMVTIGQPASLPAVSAGNDVAVCAGQSVTLSGSGAVSYSWNNNVTNGVAFTPAATATYTVTGTDANGCTNTDDVTVTVNSLPTVDGGSDVTICNGQTVTLSGSGTVSYSWTGGITDGVAFSPAASAVYTVTGTDANGCTDTDDVAVTVNPGPAVSAGNDITVCAGQQVTLSGSGASSYSWDNGVTNGTAFTATATTTYTVTGTDGNGCSGTDQVTVTVHQLPAVSAGNDIAVCTGSSVTLSGSGAASYSWTGGVSDGVSFTPALTATYTVTGTDGNGCVNTDDVQVTVNALPVVNAGSDATICAGQTLTLSGSGAVSYSWNNGVTDGVAFAPASSSSYVVTGTDGNGCTDTDTVSVTVNALPMVGAGNDITVCAGTSVTLSGSGASSYSWNNGINNNAAFTATATTTYTVTGTDGNGCSNTDDVTVTVNALPAVNAGNDIAVCAGASVTLSGSGAATYTWNNGVTDGVSFSPAATATYTVTGTDGNGCSNTDMITVTVNPLPNVSASGGNTSICAGQSLTLSGSGAVSYTWDNNVTDGVPFVPAGSGQYTVTGTDANGCSNTDGIQVTVLALPSISAGADFAICAGGQATLTASGGNSYSWTNNVTNGVAFTPAATASYVVTGTGSNGCENTDTVTVTVNALPNVSAGSDAAVCDGSTLTLNGSGAVSYTWDNGVTDGVPFVPAGPGTYTVTGTDANGCVNTDAMNVTINALPVVNAGMDQTTCNGASVILTATGAQTYTWSNGATNGMAFIPTATATYTVTGTDGNGCSGTDDVTVTVYVPSISNSNGSFTVCKGDTITLVAPAGTGYIWKRNGVKINNQTSATLKIHKQGTASYTVTYNDPMCGLVTTPPVDIEVFKIPNKPGITAPTPVCVGQTMQITATDGYVSYSWTRNGVAIGDSSHNTLTIDTSGSFNVVVTDTNGCQSALSPVKKINYKQLPVSTIKVQKVFSNGSVRLMANSGATYQWYQDSVAIANGTDRYQLITQSGYYRLYIVGQNGCDAMSADTFITVNYNGNKLTAEEQAFLDGEEPAEDGITEEAEAAAEVVTVSPNPSTGIFNISSSQPLRAVVRDIQGRVVLDKANAVTVDLSNEVPGIYLIQLYSDEGKVLRTEKLNKL